MTINDIIEYRKTSLGNCLSTSHTMSYKEFNEMLPQLRKLFKWFDVSIKPNIVTVKISALGKRKR